MAKVPRWFLVPLAVGFGVVPVKEGVQFGWLEAEAQGVGLKEPERKIFVDSTISNCIRNQQVMPENKGISSTVLADYCKCIANGIADRLSASDVSAIYTLPPEQLLEVLKPKALAAAKPCIAAMPELR